MATGFDPDGSPPIPFALDLSSGGTLLPSPVLGDDRTRAWEADVILASLDDVRDLAAELVSVTPRPAIGRMDHGSLIVEGINAGGEPGRFGDLTIPTRSGEETWRAALADISVAAELFADVWRVHVRFVVGNRVS